MPEKDQTDFNDLHAAEGLPAVRAQIDAALAGEGICPDPAATDAEYFGDPAGSPAPPPVVEVFPRQSLEACLKRYSLTMPKARVWDDHAKEILLQSAFKALIGKEVFDQWLGHEDRRTVQDDQARQALAAAQAVRGRGGLPEALKRYVYLEPTDSVWDEERCEVVPINGLRYVIADCFDDWIKHMSRRQIHRDNLVFDPTQKVDPATHINMFKGLPFKKHRNDGACRWIREMMWFLCNEDQDVFHWLMCWLAYPLQNVGAKMATAILMHSTVQGSGKSLLFDVVMRKIYGDYGATLGQHQLESQYTDWRSQKLYGLFEEVLSRDQKYSHTGTIKHMITGATHRVEKKFVSGWEEANHMNAVFLSNEVQPFPIEPSDRRMMVIWPTRTLDPDLLKKVVAELDTGGPETFYAYLMEYPLGDFNAHTKPIVTEAKERLIEFGRPGWDVFLRCWRRGDLEVKFIPCLTSDLYKVYRNWCRTNGEHSMTHTRFSTLLAAEIPKKNDQRYRFGKAEKKGAFFMVAEVPDGKTKIDWLADSVAEFRKSMQAEEHYGQE